MTIIISEHNGVTLPGGQLLGCVGENKLRRIRVIHPHFLGANYYLRLVTPDESCYQLIISDGIIEVPGSVLAAAGECSACFIAVKQGDNEELVFRSELFTLKIAPSLSSQVQPVPAYEQAKDIFNELIETMKRIGLTASSADAAISPDALGVTVSDAQSE